MQNIVKKIIVKSMLIIIYYYNYILIQNVNMKIAKEMLIIENEK